MTNLEKVLDQETRVPPGRPGGLTSTGGPSTDAVIPAMHNEPDKGL